MGETRRATEVQASMLEVIAENMEISNKQTGEIATASIEQRKVNDATIASMTIALQTGNDMLMAVEGVTSSIGGVYRELELLQGEMKFFRTGADVNIPLSGAE
jgi:methyl-accepting chemotaxis protein